MGARGRKKKIYKIKDYNNYLHLEHKDPLRDVLRNYVTAKSLCRGPYNKYNLWEMIKSKGEIWQR